MNDALPPTEDWVKVNADGVRMKQTGAGVSDNQ